MPLVRYLTMLRWAIRDRHLCPEGCPDRVQLSRKDALAAAWRLGDPLGNVGVRRSRTCNCSWRFGRPHVICGRHAFWPTSDDQA